MVNDGINLLAWCKRERERLQMQREMLHSGRFRIFEKDEAGQRDISDQHIAQIAQVPTHHIQAAVSVISPAYGHLLDTIP